MKKIVSIILVIVTLAVSLMGCSGDTVSESSGIYATSSGEIEKYAQWLEDRLTSDGVEFDGIFVGTAETAEEYGIDLSGLSDEGYVIRRAAVGSETLIFGVTADGLDRAVRYYANYCDKSAPLSVVSGEGYRVGSITVCGADISEYVIVTPAEPFYTETYAADELRKYIDKSVGVTLPIISETDWDGEGFAFVLAQDKSEDAVLGEEAFTIKSHEDGITITGGCYRGCMYGVYTFLEDYIGWRFYYKAGDDKGVLDDAAEYLYEAESIVIDVDDIDIFEEAGIDYRRMNDGPFSPKLKSNSLKQSPFGVPYYPDNACHRFKDWFSDEEMAMYGPSPNLDNSNPCFSNPDMIEELCSRIKNHVERYNPDYVDISHLDIQKFCMCDGCVEIIQKTGALSGVTITLANTVAEFLADNGYGNVRVHTFAYYGTEKAPKNLTVHPQVQVSYCFYVAQKGQVRICGNHSYSGEGCPINSEYYTKDFLEWRELCNYLHVWTYPGSYYYDVDSSPGLHQIYYDAKFLAENDVDGVIALYGAGINNVSLLAHNLMEQMFWQTPDTFEEYLDLIKEYCKLIYGAESGEFVYEYLMILEEAGDRQGCWSNLHDSPLSRLNYSYIKESSERIFTLFEMAHRYAETSYEEELVDRLFTNALFNVAAANHTAWWIKGDDASRERYKNLLDAYCELGVKYGHVLDACGATVPEVGTFDYNESPLKMFKETIGKWDFDLDF